MADDYQIVARIVAEDATGAGASGAERHLDGVQEHARRTGANITSILSRAFAIVGGAAGVGMAVKGIVGLHATAQDATNGIAALLNVQTGAPINTTLARARELVQGLKQDAAAGVGELNDYTQGFQRLLSPGLGAGGSLDQIKELNKLAIAGAGALYGAEGTALGPADVAQAILQGANPTETPVVMQALSASGVTQKKFNAMSQSDRLTTLLAAFGKFGPAIELMGKSWNAQMSTFQDSVKSVIADVTRPLFDKWTEQLRDVNDWFKEHQVQIKNITDTWGPKLVALWDHLVKQAGTYAALVGAAAVAQVIPLGGAAARVGPGVAASGMPYLTRELAVVGGVVKAGGGGGVLAALGGSLSGIMGSLSALAGPLLIVAGAFLAVKGAIGEFPGLLIWLGDEARQFMAAIGDLGSAFGMLTARGSALNIVGAAIVGVIGGIIGTMTDMVKVSATVVTAFGLLFRVLGFIGKAIVAIFHGDIGVLDTLKTDITGAAADAWALTKDMWVPKEVDTPAEWQGPKQDLPTTKPPVVNIGQVTINQRIEANDDPVRIVRAFDSAIEHVEKYRRQSRRRFAPAL